MKLLKGKKISEKILNSLKNKIKKEKLKPALAVVLVGDNIASRIYVSLKEKAAGKIGIKFYLHKFSAKAKEMEIIKSIKKLNTDKKISGIIVQLPLPKNLNTQKIINAIDPKKDADGFSAFGRPAEGWHQKDKIEPVLPKAIMKILEIKNLRLNLRFRGAMIVANSEKFGKIMVASLKQKKISGVYILAKEIKKNRIKIKKADVVISAVGKPGLIRGDMIKKGAIVIDAGITKKGKKVLGDVDFTSVKTKASYITPVPGGVGPVTIACLLENVYLLSKKSH